MEYYELTNPQKRIWYTEKICPDTAMNNIGGAFRILGKVEFKILNEAVNFFIMENDGIRIRLTEKGNQVYQYVRDYEFEKFEFADFTKEKNSITYGEWLENLGSRKFELCDKDLFHFTLFKKSEQEGGFCIILHHIIADGWSMSLLVNQICKYYENILHNRKEEIDNGSYLDYLKVEKQYLMSERCQRDKDFWMEHLKDSNVLAIGQEYEDSAGRRCRFDLEVETWGKIRTWLVQQNLSMDIYFVSLFLLYDHKRHHKWEKTITLPVYNRIGRSEKKMFGMFTSTIPFRFAFDDSKSILQEMHRMSDNLKKCYRHQRYPYNQLVNDLRTDQKGSVNLYIESVNIYNTKLNILCNGYETEIDEIYNGHQSYPLQMVVKAWNHIDNVSIMFDYKRNEYTEEDINDIYQGMIKLAKIIMANPEQSVGQILCMENEYIHWIHSVYNNTYYGNIEQRTIAQLFEEQVKLTPNRTAVRFEKSSLTFEELNQKANQLARRLKQQGMKGEKVVGLLATHSIETLIGILGILKAGGAYLPLDTAHPESRWFNILELASVDMVLTNIQTSDQMNQRFSIIFLNRFQYVEYDNANLFEYSRNDDLAYILFTSGSTGMPKGIMVENRQLVNYIVWAKKMYISSEDDVFPFYSSLAFDLTVTSIFVPLLSGCQIVVYHNEEYAHPIMQIIEENVATVIKLTPAHLDLFKASDNSNSKIKKMIVGGELFKKDLAKSITESFNGHVELYNEYGPTETTVGCMIHKYDIEKDCSYGVPIGVPADNTHIYVLDSKLNIVEPNMEGEICIAGCGVTRGYINEEELTRKCFVQNPYIPGERMYKSGDLGKVMDDGMIQYIGRKDNQVKIRGYRIELNEIEQCLLRYQKVKSAIVKGYVNSQNVQYLAAFVILKDSVKENELYEYLKSQFPEYMVPIYYEYLEQFPITPNGKIDTKKLLVDESRLWDKLKGDNNGKIKEVLLNAVKNIMGCSNVNASSNFFNIGGDSIKAIQISSQLRTEGFKLTVTDILSNPVIYNMNACIQKVNREAKVHRAKGEIILPPIASWFMEQQLQNIGFYHQCVLLRLKNNLSIVEIEKVLTELVKIHNALRINYDSNTGRLYYNESHWNKKVMITEHQIECSDFKQSIPMIKDKLEVLISDTDISTDFLFHADLFSLCNEKVLTLYAHHLVVDGMSWQIFLNNMNYMFEHKEMEEYPMLQEQSSLQAWVNELDEYGVGVAIDDIDYWTNCIEIKDKKEEGFQKEECHDYIEIALELNEHDTHRLVETARKAYGMTIFEAVSLAILQSIKDLFQQKDVLLELEGNGRVTFGDKLDISKTVGWFTSMYPFRYSFKEEDISMQIKNVKESLRNIPNGGISYGILRYMKQIKEMGYPKCVRLNYLGDIMNYSDQYFELIDCFALKAKENASTSLLNVDCGIRNQKLVFCITKSYGYLSCDNARQFSQKLIDTLKELIEICSQQKQRQFTPSDFEMVQLTQQDLDSLFL